MKRILTLLLACVLLCTTAVTAAEFTDMQPGDAFYDEVQTLCALGIVSGDAAGTLRPHAALSRAEFAKLAVGLLDKLSEAKLTVGTSRFYDVERTHWALPYINYVAANGIIVGYPDGSFGAEEEITYAQAITVVLRLLGYDENTLGGFWPDSYINKAITLELTEGIHVQPDASIPRADAFVLLANALDTESYGTKTKLISGFGYSVVEDAVLLSTYATDAALANGEVKTTAGIYKCDTADALDQLVGCKVKLYLDAQSKLVTAQPYADYPTRLVIKKHLGGNTYLCASDAGECTQNFSNTMTVYGETGKSSYAQMALEFVPGAVVTLHGETAGGVDYAFLSAAEEITPVIATKSYVQGDTQIGTLQLTDVEHITVYRDGYAAALTDICADDVVYYNPTAQTIEVYTDKVTGLYEEALPSKAHVTQVVVGGRSFNVGETATRRLDETAGSYKINDVVTLLLGKDGEVVGIGNTSSGATAYGVLLYADTYIAESVTESGSSKYRVQLMLSDGNIYTYDAAKDYSEHKGCMVHIEFDDGKAVLRKVYGGEFEGEVSQTSHRIGTTAVATDAVLFNLISNPTNGAASAQVLDFEDLKEVYVRKDCVRSSVKMGSFGEVAVVLFDDVLHANVRYGIVTDISSLQRGDSVTRTYSVLVDGQTQKVVRQGRFDVTTGAPAMITYEGSSIKTLEPLKKVATGSRIQAIDYSRIKVDGKIYPLSSTLLIYHKPGMGEYCTLSRNELEQAEVSEVILYTDFTNQVRAIRVQLK